jgi:hypothetical protein
MLLQELAIHKRTSIFILRFLVFRLVKLTVNFDDPTTYHLYFGGGARVQSLLCFHGQMRLKDRTVRGPTKRFSDTEVLTLHDPDRLRIRVCTK